MDTALWHIPAYSAATYYGRTQVRCTPVALPEDSASQAIINLDTYNPTGFSFYGTDVISNRTFKPGNGIIVTVHAKIKQPVVGGIVGGIYFYDLIAGDTGTIHNEIDFELLTNDSNAVNTNVYSNEPLGAGHPVSSTIDSPITCYHTYVIEWLPCEVLWLIDGDTMRRSNIVPVPTDSMQFNLNMWAPDASWSAAYNGSIQPTSNPLSDLTWSMIVDSVRIDSLLAPACGVLGIQGQKKSEISFYPNPAHGFIHLIIPEDNAVTVSIYNVMGELLISKKDMVSGDLSIANLPAGIYMFRYEKDNIVINCQKLIIY